MVCELLEGETLRERLLGGAVSSKKAIELATHIAQGWLQPTTRVLSIAI
jgi:hypothetical protein